MENDIYKLVLSVVVLCFSSLTFAGECEDGKRTIKDWIDYNSTFKELSLPKSLIESEVCVYEPSDVIATDSFPEINAFIKQWKLDNEVRGHVKGQKLVNLIEILGSKFDLSLGQVCFDEQTELSITCQSKHLVYVSIKQNLGENKTKVSKFILGKFAG